MVAPKVIRADMQEIAMAKRIVFFERWLRYAPVFLHPGGSGFEPMNQMCEKAEMSERQIFFRTKAEFGYFNLPFDAEPPR